MQKYNVCFYSIANVIVKGDSAQTFFGSVYSIFFECCLWLPVSLLLSNNSIITVSQLLVTVDLKCALTAKLLDRFEMNFFPLRVPMPLSIKPPGPVKKNLLHKNNKQNVSL